MTHRKAYVIGSGPNGLMAAITLARAGVETTVLESQPTFGGAMRSAALTEPGFIHDIGSAVYPMAAASPAFAGLPLSDHGLEWIHPSAPLAHPLDNGSAIVLERSIEETAGALGVDAASYRRVITPFVRDWPQLKSEILMPLHLPRHPLLMAGFGMRALQPATWIGSLFKSREARALFGGLAGHSIMPLDRWSSSAVAWVLMIAGHASGWPIARGGSQKIADAMSSYLRSLGGELVSSKKVSALGELNDADLVLCDTSPQQLLRLAGDALPAGYRRKLSAYRYGPGVFKMDWALSGPIPWTAASCARAGTVHLGGTLEEITAAESSLFDPAARPSDRPFVLLAQPSLFDKTRAPVGRHTAWAYCHVPNGSTADRTAAIEGQIERFAPGFKDRILKRHVMTTADLEASNANLVGGDISGGRQTLDQLFLRPTRQLYRTPQRGLYLCSASTPPGGGVHGMCGFYAATAALKDLA